MATPRTHQKIQKVQTAKVADFDDQLWPINLAIVILGGFVAGLVFAYSDFQDARILYNGWTRLVFVGLMVAGLMWAVHWLEGKMLRRLRLCIILALLVNLWVLMWAAREYLALLEPRARYHTEPMDLLLPSPPQSAATPEVMESRFEIAPTAARSQGPRAVGVAHARRQPGPEPAETVAGGLWHRIPLGDEAEFVISERVYARHRDRVDWLVRWARKVFT